MNRDLVPTSSLERFLQELGDDYAVAKNPDIWGSLERGGDWDLIVSQPERAAVLLRRCVGAPERVVRRSYVTAFYFDWGEIDLLPAIDWRGIRLISASSVLARARVSETGIRIASSLDQAIAGWFIPIVSHGSAKERYLAPVAATLNEAQDELGSLLRALLDERLVVEILSIAKQGGIAFPAVLRRRVRRGLFLRSLLVSPLATSSRSVRFLWRELVVRSALGRRGRGAADHLLPDE